MTRGTNPNSVAALRSAHAAGNNKRSVRRAEGLAWARAWRQRMRPHFDALYGASSC